MALTYRQASEAVSGRVVWWAEVSGIPYAFSDSGITESNKSTLFGDAYTPTLTFWQLLAPIKGTYTRSIEIVPGKSSAGGFTLSLIDAATETYPDGFLTWLFGGDRTSIVRSRLFTDVEKHAGGVGHDWNIADTTGWSADIDYYCGLETVRPDNVTAGVNGSIDDVTRSRWNSPATAHRSRRYAGTNAEWPEVTNHPTVWRGRIVTLYQTYMDGAGELATDTGATSGCRAAAHKVRGILRDVEYRNGMWQLRVDSLDTILKRNLVRGQPWVYLSQPIDVEANDLGNWGAFDGTETTGYVLRVLLTDPTTMQQDSYDIAVDAARYSVDTLLDAVNAEAAVQVTNGTLRMHATPSTLHVTYTTGAVTAMFCEVKFAVSIQDAAHHSTSAYVWEAFGLGFSDDGDFAHGADVFAVTPPDAVVTSTPYTTILGRTSPAISLRPNETVAVSVMGNDEFTGSSFAQNDRVAIISDHVSFAKVVEVASTQMVLQPIGYSFRASTHQQTAETPIKLQRMFWMSRQAGEHLGSTTLRLLLSTGLANYNATTYDSEYEGIGIEVPHETPAAGASSTESVINVEAFETFFAEQAHVERIVDAIWEPTQALEWLRSRIGFLGGHLLVEDGQITVRRGVSSNRAASVGTVTEGEIVPSERRVAFGDASTVDGIRFKCNYDPQRDMFRQTLAVTRAHVRADDAQNIVDYEDKGLWFGVDDLLQHGDELLADFKDEGWVYTFTLDRAFRDLEPGQVINLSDEGSEDTSNEARLYQGMPTSAGTRGLSNTYATILSASTSEQTGTTEVSAVVTRRNRSGYSASAWVSSYVNGGSTAVLTCEANVFRPSADGADAAAFTVGDKVRLLWVNSVRAGTAGLPDSDDAGQSGLTVTDVSGNTITINALVDTDFVSGTTPMVLTHDPYQTASQTTAAKNWAHVGDSSGDIGDGGDRCFEW